MTKKDYELIAKVFNKNYSQAKVGMFNKWSVSQVIKAQALQMADVLKTDNPKFDTTKFTQACGVGQAAYVNSKGETVNY